MRTHRVAATKSSDGRARNLGDHAGTTRSARRRTTWGFALAVHGEEVRHIAYDLA